MLSEKQLKKAEYSRKYRQKNKEKIRAYSREYERTHKRKRYRKASAQDKMHRRNTRIALSDRRVYGVIKRPYEGYCELCGKVVGEGIKVVDYHHWDNSDVKPGKKVKGIWVCYQCHRLCELIDKKYIHLIPRYLRFKRALNKQHKIQEEIKPELN